MGLCLGPEIGAHDSAERSVRSQDAFLLKGRVDVNQTAQAALPGHG